MTNTPRQIEKNVSASFGYVKKDMLMLNDAFSDLHDQIQHLSLNHAMLLGEIEKLKKKLGMKATKKTSKKETLEFYDLKAKKKFKSSEYRIVNKSGRKFAVAKNPSGSESYRIIGSSNTKKKATKKTAKKTKAKKAPKKAVKKNK
jgi:regulator of replication initiation timing